MDFESFNYGCKNEFNKNLVKEYLSSRQNIEE